MIGRADERVLLEGLLADGRSGRSGTLVLVGEAGVGKSVVLSHAMGLSDGFLVLRATGVESEEALGLADHTSHDRNLIGVAVLSLLSEAAEDSPVLCVVEDAHWLDVPSVEAIDRRCLVDGQRPRASRSGDNAGRHLRSLSRPKTHLVRGRRKGPTMDPMDCGSFQRITLLRR